MMSTPDTHKILVSNHHSLIKGARAPWKNGQFQGWRGEVKDEPGLFVVSKNMAVLKKIMGACQKNIGANLKELPRAKYGTN